MSIVKSQDRVKKKHEKVNTRPLYLMKFNAAKAIQKCIASYYEMWCRRVVPILLTVKKKKFIRGQALL